MNVSTFHTMTSQAIGITISLLFICTAPVYSQERNAANNNKDSAEMKRENQPARAQGARGRGNQGSVEVKDPADYNQAQEKTVFSGPQPGEPLPPLTITGLNGDAADKEFDLAAMANGKPLMIFFMDDTGVGLRGLAGFSRMISPILRKTKEELHLAVVFLTDDINAFSQKAKNYKNFLVDFTIGISKDGRDGPGAYGLNRNVSETIVLAKEGKVTRNFIFPQGMLYPDPHVLGAIAEVLGEDRETLAKWLNEQPAEGEQMMRGGGRMQDHAVTPQAALRKLLGEMVEKGKLTREEAVHLFKTAFPETR